jgi:putative nucleotidyltransferase-like protein
VTEVPKELWPIVWRLATGSDWPPRDNAHVPAFFDFANREKLFPLVMAEGDLPAEIVSAKPRFQALRALYRTRYELARDAILELQRVLGTEAFLLLKGSDYCYRLYARPELRPMADVDILIPTAKFQQMIERLAAAGYPRKYSDFGAGFAPGHHEISIEVGSVHVEPHRSFAQRVRAGIDYDGMWQRREPFESEGISCYRLAPADAILGHAFNLAIDEFSSQFIRYVDFFLLLQRYESQLPECVARAKAWQIERALFGALYLISNLFPASATPTVKQAIELLLDARTRRFLIDRVLPDPAKEPSGHVTGRHVQLWRKYSLMDRRWRSLALCAYSAYETSVGSAIEWKTRRSGRFVPPRPTPSSR